MVNDRPASPYAYDKHVDGINEHRKKAGMEEYHPPKVEQNVRKVRKIDDYMRNKG